MAVDAQPFGARGDRYLHRARRARRPFEVVARSTAVLGIREDLAVTAREMVEVRVLRPIVPERGLADEDRPGASGCRRRVATRAGAAADVLVAGVALRAVRDARPRDGARAEGIAGVVEGVAGEAAPDDLAHVPVVGEIGAHHRLAQAGSERLMEERPPLVIAVATSAALRVLQGGLERRRLESRTQSS